jgi:hypothetical protein
VNTAVTAHQVRSKMAPHSPARNTESWRSHHVIIKRAKEYAHVDLIRLARSCIGG